MVSNDQMTLAAYQMYVITSGFKGMWNKYAHVKFMTQYFLAFKTIYKCFFTPNTREQEQNKMITD